MTDTELPPFIENDWASAAVTVSETAEGIQYVSSPYEVLDGDDNIIAMFQNTATQFPDRQFLGRRNKDNNEWEFISYQETDEQSSAVAQWLLNLDIEPNRPVMILSGNSFEHALFMLGAMKARMPVVPTSPNYCLISDDHKKINKLYTLVEPAVVFAQDLELYGKAISSFDNKQLKTVFVDGDISSPYSTEFQKILDTKVTEEVTDSISSIEPDDIAKILFTSGSTGDPKGVINTHKNLISTINSLDSVVKNDPINTPPIMLDWMPWHHTFAGNHNIHRIIRYAGTLYIDEGKPLPKLFEKTIENLTSVPISGYTTVPAVYSLLVNIMKTNTVLRKNFFKNLQWFCYGGADMPQSICDEIQKMAISETGRRISVITGLGSTESSSLITNVHWNCEKTGNIGLPIPRTTLKLIPIDDKYEMRVKAPQITPSYYKNEAKTKESFDEEGYFITGDAVRWSNNDNYREGLLFAGRVCEDFKLTNGTWVHTGALRSSVLSKLAPLIDDFVVCGQNKSYISLLLWINEAAARAQLDDNNTPFIDLLYSEKLAQHLQNIFKQYNQAKGSTMRISKVLNMSTPPSADKGEVSDKRSINQSAVLKNRAHLVEKLYADIPDKQVIVFSK